MKSLELSALYDPGANISIISLDTVNKIGNILIHAIDETGNNLCKTMSGEARLIGLIKIDITIFNLTCPVWLFVMNTLDHELVIGLDLIQKFRLNQDYKLNVFQTPFDTEKNTIENSFDNSKYPSINWGEYMPRDKFLNDIRHLSGHDQKDILELVDDFKSLFAKDKYDVGNFQRDQANIQLTENKYIARRPYRCTYADQLEIDSQVQGLLQAGLIEESSSPYASPVTMAFRKSENERNRMCIDFREMNKIVIPQTYPFPTIEDIILKTKGSTCFSTLDINSAFWSIPLNPNDRHKTGFITLEGHYQWKCMPFGIKIASPTFQRILSGIIRKYSLSSFCINYIDDILVFSRSFKDHIPHLRSVFSAIQKEGFRLKFAKCEFARKKVKYLGHILECDGTRPLLDNVAAIRDFVATCRTTTRR